jgi:hypothetical protein
LLIFLRYPAPCNRKAKDCTNGKGCFGAIV